jgi:ADP-ribosylglycohydrolase
MEQLGTARSVLYCQAIGDAIGWPVEFESANYVSHMLDTWGLGSGIGVYTDDTQMTIHCSYAVHQMGRDNFQPEIAWESYQRWAETQQMPGKARAPGLTVMRSLRGGIPGTLKNRINNSKGNGGVMRVAPYGITASTPDKAFELACLDAAMTHSHPFGFITAGIQAYMIWGGLHGQSPTDTLYLLHSTFEITLRCLNTFGIIDSEYDECLNYMSDLMDLTVSAYGAEDEQVIAFADKYGEGTGDNSLYIALYALLKYGDAFVDGVRACITTDGDSDTHAAIYGAMYGAYYGMDEVPQKWIDKLEERNDLDRAIAALTLVT